MSTTHEIAALAWGLMDDIEAADGEATPELDARLAAFAEAAADKLGALHAVHRRLQAEEAHEDGYLRRAKARRDAARSALDRVAALTLRLLDAVEATTGEARAFGDGWRLSVRPSVAVEVVAEGLPWLAETRPDLVSLRPVADKAAIRRALEAGEDVPGTVLLRRRNVRWT